jgi:hypothetical protein
MWDSRSMAAVPLALALVLGGGSLAFTQEKPARPERGERHPQIHAAMRALHVAARHLERAEHDFGGHRAKALELVRQAEGELKEALEYARAHPELGGKPGAGPSGAPPTAQPPKTR